MVCEEVVSIYTWEGSPRQGGVDHKITVSKTHYLARGLFNVAIGSPMIENSAVRCYLHRAEWVSGSGSRA